MTRPHIVIRRSPTTVNHYTYAPRARITRIPTPKVIGLQVLVSRTDRWSKAQPSSHALSLRAKYQRPSLMV